MANKFGFYQLSNFESFVLGLQVTVLGFAKLGTLKLESWVKVQKINRIPKVEPNSVCPNFAKPVLQAGRFGVPKNLK